MKDIDFSGSLTFENSSQNASSECEAAFFNSTDHSKKCRKRRVHKQKYNCRNIHQKCNAPTNNGHDEIEKIQVTIKKACRSTNEVDCRCNDKSVVRCSSSHSLSGYVNSINKRFCIDQNSSTISKMELNSEKLSNCKWKTIKNCDSDCEPSIMENKKRLVTNKNDCKKGIKLKSGKDTKVKHEATVSEVCGSHKRLVVDSDSSNISDSESTNTERRIKKNSEYTGLLKYFSKTDAQEKVNTSIVKCTFPLKKNERNTEIVTHCNKIQLSANQVTRSDTINTSRKLRKQCTSPILETKLVVQAAANKNVLKELPKNTNRIRKSKGDGNKQQCTSNENNSVNINVNKITINNETVFDKPIVSRPLAPLFLKQNVLKKNENKKAKIEFLNSGIPEIVRKMIDTQKSEIEEYKGEYVFPSISHIFQYDKKVINPISIPLINRIIIKSDSLINFNKLYLPECYASLIERCDNIMEQVLENLNTQTIQIEKEIKLLKRRVGNMNVAEMHTNIMKCFKEFEVTDKLDVDNIYGTLGFLEKYKPSTSEGILGNTGSIQKLKEWIESHKRITCSYGDEDNSEDEFVHNDDSNDSVKYKNNVTLLVGPPGCGKTCAVYAIARELGFQVLEINAGNNRNGKRILGELLESTQSHQIKRDISLFNGNKNIKHCKKKQKIDKKSDEKMSLILIEDADILFENYDEGYLSAVNSITELSKRPVIFTANNLHHPHLMKYNNGHNLVLHFAYPSWTLISTWLQLIALAEGVKLSREIIYNLLDTAGTDIRKNLLQLQMLVLSQNKFSDVTIVEPLCVYKWSVLSPLEHVVHKEYKSKNKLIAGNVLKCDTDAKIIHGHIMEYSVFLDRLSSIDTLNPDISEQYKETCFQTRIRKSPSDPQYTENFLVEDLNSKLFCYCRSNIKSVAENSSKILFDTLLERKRWQNNIYNSAGNALSNIVPKYSTYRAGYCDYLPAIRTIARLEETRLAGNTKRTSRYFNYLKSVNVHLTNSDSHILCKSLM